MRTLVAVIGGSALVAMGAMTVAIAQEQGQPAQTVELRHHEHGRDEHSGNAADGA